MHHYPSDVTDEQWPLIEPHLPAARPGGRPRTTDMRDVLDAIFYILRTGCQWRYLPVDLPPKSTETVRWSASGKPGDRPRSYPDGSDRPFRENTSCPGVPPSTFAGMHFSMISAVAV